MEHAAAQKGKVIGLKGFPWICVKCLRTQSCGTVLPTVSQGGWEILREHILNLGQFMVIRFLSICSYTFEATLISISPILPSATQPIHIHCTPTPSQKYEFLIEFPSNTNMNTIRLFQYDRIRIRILFGFSKMTEYEYEYYSAFQKWPNTNTNTNTIRF